MNSRGEDTKDLLVNLFKGYMSTTDENFTRYIQAKQDAYDDQSITMDEEKLMLLALNKYKILVEQGVWSAKNKQEEKIIALQSQIAQLSASNNRTNSSENNTNDRKKLMSPDEWERFKKWAAIKPSDLNKGYYFKVESNNNRSGPYYWCNEHERLCKKFCRHVKKQMETNDSNKNSNNLAKLESNDNKQVAMNATMHNDDEVSSVQLYNY